MAARKRRPGKQAAGKKKRLKRKGRPAPGEKRGDKILADRLIQVREGHGLTRVAVSEATGVNYESLSGYELGQEHPPFRRIRLLAMYYGVSLDYLAGITDRLLIKKGVTKKAARRKRDR